MAATHYHDVRCKSALNRVSGMPFKWSLNPYRGCVHACHYCYAREMHTYLGLDAEGDFERQIFIKGNIASVLDRELSRPGWRGESVAIGTATDAYQPAEKRFRLTRACIETLGRHGNPFSVVTKSSLIVRDLDLLLAARERADIRIYFTVTTVDPELAERIEPGAFPPAIRLRALDTLASAGITCGVMMAPVMPGINDSQASIDAVARSAADAGASSFWAGPLRLAPPVRNHFYGFLQQEFPELLTWYLKHLDGQHLPRLDQELIAHRAERARSRFGLDESTRRGTPEPAPSPVLQLQQLSFPLSDDPAPIELPLRYDPLSA
ncbi:MAG: radical SAM protein [Thermomicrobiales bacterium]|nr:radical SAM protein [Thermomicrobiales bacterium]MCO5223330.1 radical SAM protein [Thermomicrobiales bacterium]